MSKQYKLSSSVDFGVLVEAFLLVQISPVSRQTKTVQGDKDLDTKHSP